MQRGRYRRTVHQGRIDEIETDKALFVFLRKQIARHRGRIRKMFTLKCIQAMYFVKVSDVKYSPKLFGSILMQMSVPPPGMRQCRSSQPRALLHIFRTQNM
jgi:hypothetical protein